MPAKAGIHDFGVDRESVIGAGETHSQGRNFPLAHGAR
jgi:hypothetical protein